MEIIVALLPVIVMGAPFVLWAAMLIHAINNDNPNKPLWLTALIFGNIFGAVVYYCVVYAKDGKKGRPMISRQTAIVFGAIIAMLLLFIILFALPTHHFSSTSH